MNLTVRRIDPLTMADAIKALFVQNGRPEFPQWFDRAYPLAVRDSWVTVEPDGRVIAHVAAFRSVMSVDGTDVTGALLSNLMADQGHRTFFPVVVAVKRAVKDLRAAGAAFVYTDPANDGAVAVMRAAGLRRVGVLNRFLLPLGHRRSPLDLLAGGRLWARRRRLGDVTAQRVEVPDAVEWTVRERCEVSPVTARRSPDVYALRWGRLDTATTAAFLIRDGSGRDVGASIVWMTPDKADAVLITLRCRALEHVAASVAALGDALRRAGLPRLNTRVLEGTPFARALVDGGFIRRREPTALVAAGFTDAGRAVAAGLATCDIEKIDLD